jgi:hypothetical protein
VGPADTRLQDTQQQADRRIYCQPPGEVGKQLSAISYQLLAKGGMEKVKALASNQFGEQQAEG